MANLRVDKITSTETFETTGSVQFDGSGDFLSLAVSSDFQFGSGDFTIECWALAFDEGTDDILGIYNTGDDRRTFALRKDQTESMQFLFSSDGSSGTSIDSADGIISLNTWHHYAVVRKDLEYTIYLDGKNVGSKVISDAIYTNSDDGLRIGSSHNTDFDGHISNVRIVKDIALYTENFKPSMRELEVVPGTVLLCCQSKTDATLEKTGKTLTVNGQAVANELTPGILTPVPKAGAGSAITGSVEFTGDPDHLTVGSASDWTFLHNGTTHTVECWFNSSEEGNAPITDLPLINTAGTPSAVGFGLFISQGTNGNVRANFNKGSGDALIAQSPGSLWKPHTWNHLAAVYDSSTSYLTVYLNGVDVASTDGSSYAFSSADPTYTLALARNQVSSPNYSKVFISNARIVKGTALYTDDFIPPTRELKKVPGTVLLACQDPDNPLTEATGKTITGYGDLSPGGGSNLVSNAYDADAPGDTTGWSTDQGASLSVSSGRLRVTNGSSDYGIAQTSVTTITGQRYVVRADFHPGTANQGELRASNTSFSNTLGGTGLNASSPKSLTFTAASTTTYINVYGSNTTGEYSEWANFSVTLAEGSNKGSNFTPQVGDDRKVTFEGVTKINSDAYFCLPTGDTVTRDSRYGRGLIVGGSNSNAIEYINISTLGNSQDYGDLSAVTSYVSALASSTRGVYSRSRTPSSPNGDNTLEYSTLATTSNSIDFGDRTVSVYEVGALSNNTRGIIGGGYGSDNSDVIDYVTIASTGDAIDFGNLTQARRGLNGLASPTRGCFAAGYQQPDTTTETDIIDYVTIASTGNAQDFGDLIAAVWGPASLASPTRGIWAGGIDPNATDVINYVTISSTGNAQDFGDLTVAKGRNAGMSNSTRGVIGLEGLNTMDYITIATTGNAQDFGDMMRTISGVRGACSDSHGGLG